MSLVERSIIHSPYLGRVPYQRFYCVHINLSQYTCFIVNFDFSPSNSVSNTTSWITEKHLYHTSHKWLRYCLTSMTYSPGSAIKVIVPCPFGCSIIRCSMREFSFTVPNMSPPDMWFPTYMKLYCQCGLRRNTKVVATKHGTISYSAEIYSYLECLWWFKRPHSGCA